MNLGLSGGELGALLNIDCPNKTLCARGANVFAGVLAQKSEVDIKPMSIAFDVKVSFINLI